MNYKIKRPLSLTTCSFIFFFLLHSIGFAISLPTSPLFPGQIYPTGKNPTSIVIGDFNGDGKFDLAVANLDSGSVSILIGKESKKDEKGNERFGGFEPKIDYTIGGKPSSIAVGDFNGDRKPDLAIANSDNGLVSILLGNGDGTFTNSNVYYAAGRNSNFILVEDFNGDGKRDLAVVNYISNSVSILLGNGDGSFKPKVDYTTGDRPSSMIIKDLNGDYKLDLAIANYGSGSGGSVSVLLGNGDGSFKPKTDYPTGGQSSSIAVEDLNKDGKYDLVTTNFDNGSVSVLISNGDGTFQPKRDYPVEQYPLSITVGNFNGDRNLDLAVGNRDTHTVSILLGNGDGTFQPKNNYTTANSPRFIVAKDLDGDEKTDLVVANSSEINDNNNYISILLGNGDGTFQPKEYISGNTPSSITIGDFNGDGKLDAAVANSLDKSISIFLGDGQGGFTKPNPNLSVGGAYVASIVAGDFDGDKKLDLAITHTSDNGNSSVSVLIGDGQGGFQLKHDYSVKDHPKSIAVGDFNKDEKLDLAVTIDSTDSVLIFLGNGDGSFQLRGDYASGNNPQLVTVGDFDGDGKLDLATVVQDVYSISILLGNGDGSFKSNSNYPAIASPKSIAVGDFNGDRKLDLAVGNEGSNTVSILLGNGDGTFQQSGYYETGDHPQLVTAGDFNGDGKVDLAVANQYSSSISILLNNGDGTFQPHLDYLAGRFPSSAIVGDFNGDKKPDLVVTNYISNSITVLLNTRDPVPGIIQWSAARYTVNKSENAVTITVSRTDGADGPVTVDYSTVNGTAIAGKDYTATSGTLSWGDGDTADKTVKISLLNNNPTDADKTIRLLLSNPTDGATLGSQMTAAIIIPRADVSTGDNSGEAGSGGSGGCTLVQFDSDNFKSTYLFFLMGIGLLFLYRKGVKD